MEILKVENLSKVYGTGASKVVALDNVSFTVEKGEFVSIVGASGSGKSTLAKLIARVIEDNYQGNITIDNYDISEYSLENYKSNICYIVVRICSNERRSYILWMVYSIRGIRRKYIQFHSVKEIYKKRECYFF